ncbi:MAG: response regulator [Lachnospiraceae bacterium]|nr:response regulator [Lachnospiraceae bacterium]
MNDIREFVYELENLTKKKDIYRLLIADDEAWVQEELSDLIEWERYGIRLLPAAGDGEAALETVRAERPDILITDVNMPFMNGVELLKKVIDESPDTVVIMLSGYDDFHYVRESLVAGALDYLMKPISKMDLINVMKRALDVINERIVTQNDRRTERGILLSAAGSLNDREYSELITGNNAVGSSLRPLMQTMKEIPKGGFVAIMLRVASPETLLPLFEQTPSLLAYAIKHRIEQEISLPLLLLFNNIYNTEEYFLYVGGSAKEISKLSLHLRRVLSEFTSKEVTTGESSLYFSEQDFAAAAVEARRSCKKNEAAEGSAKDNVHRMIAYINENYAEELSLSELSDQYNIESTYLSRLFKKETGETLTAYITERRIEQAIKLMAEAAYSINDIATLVGYDDYNYFNRVFKKHTGYSPSEYRKLSSK